MTSRRGKSWLLAPCLALLSCVACASGNEASPVEPRQEQEPSLDARVPDSGVAARDATAPVSDGATPQDTGEQLDAQSLGDVASDPDAGRDASLPVDQTQPCRWPPDHCPSPPAPGWRDGAGLLPTDRCRFRLVDQDQWDESAQTLSALATRLPQVSVSQLLDEANREGARVDDDDVRARHVAQGFEWNSGDNRVSYWMPQGITGSGDAFPGGRLEGAHVVLVSWYFKAEEADTEQQKGVRISFARVDGAGTLRYRHALLVEPFMRDGQPDFRAVPIHAGGLVWLGPYLYVPDTRQGLRVFSMEHIFEVASDADRIGRQDGDGDYYAHRYRYVIPQINSYRLHEQSCSAKFSFLSLDRSHDPPLLLSGEYQRDSGQGLLLHWSLDPASGRLMETQPGDYRATAGFVAGHTRMQGALARDGHYYLSCSSQNLHYGSLYRTGPRSPSEEFRWVYGTEDLYYDPISDTLWTASEHPNQRTVFGVDLGAYQP